MAAGHIEIISDIVPKNSGDFATHSAEYGRGGWRAVDTVADRDAITSDRREAGMQVLVTIEDVVYQLASDLVNWTVFQNGGAGIPDAPSDGQGYVRQSGAWVPISGFLDEGTFE